MLPETLVHKLMDKDQIVTDDDFGLVDEPIKRMISESGTVGHEFRLFMDREMEQRRIEKEKEEEMSMQFILKHFSEESERTLMEQKDEEYARRLQEAEVDESRPADAAGKRMARMRSRKKTSHKGSDAGQNPAGGDTAVTFSR